MIEQSPGVDQVGEEGAPGLLVSRAPAGFTMLGATDQGSCADGSCALPTPVAPD